MTTTPRLWKSQTQVNTTDAAVGFGGTAFQGDGQITGLPDGGYVVVWTDESNTLIFGPEIMGQRYDSLGNKVGGEVVITRATDDYLSPAVTTLSNGDIAVAYLHNNNNVFDNNVSVDIYSSALVFVRTDIIDQSGSQTAEPSITALAGGGYAISYTQVLGTPVSGLDYNVVGRIVSPTGTVGALIPVQSSPDAYFGSEVATLSNGNFVVVYVDDFLSGPFFNGPEDQDIHFRIFTPAGTAVTGDLFVAGANDFGFEFDPDVAALKDGGFVVAWTDTAGNDIRATIFNNAGATIASNLLVNTTTTGLQDEANVLALADGGFLVTWEDDSAALVRAQRFDALGHKVGAEFTVHNGVVDDRDSPEAALLSDGRIAYAVGDFDDFSTNDVDVMTSIWTTGWNAVASGDFNHDGTKDILWQNAAGSTSEWLMSPSGGVASFPFTPPAAGWSVIATGNLNGDGTDDILWKNDTTGATAEWLMAPGGGASLVGTPGAPGWDVVAEGDFNGDHITDIMWKHAATGSTAEWLMAPTGGVGSLLSTPPVGGWNLIASGDFNGDGTDDLMWQNAGTGATSEWLMAGGGVAGNPSTPAAPGWKVVASGDFNGDHTTDIMWKSDATGSTAEWLMAPTGGVGSLLSAPPVGGWNLIASGDFNGDGTDDLMWQNAGTGATSEWLMAGGGVAGNPSTPAAPGWDVVASGDFNGDATIDLMWQNALTGATAEWLMAPGGGVGAFVSTLTM
jgi:hypothetical protein